MQGKNFYPCCSPMKHNIPVAAAVFALVLISQFLPAQENPENNLPSWLLLEYGKKAYDEGEYGQALKFFMGSLEKQKSYPEAERWIGKVYEAEGEYALAERQYLKAFDLRNLLYIPEDRYSILYDLSRIFYYGGKYKKYEETLQLIVKDDSQFQDRYNELPVLFVKNLKEFGIDKVLNLYRVSGQFSLDAHGRLGVFYYKTGRYDKSLLHLAYASVIACSRMLEELKRKDPEFQFRTLDAAFILAAASPPLVSYFSEVGLFDVLYYLGAALFAESEPGKAADIWNIVAKRSPAASLKDKASKQLRSPYIEPLIDFGQ